MGAVDRRSNPLSAKGEAGRDNLKPVNRDTTSLRYTLSLNGSLESTEWNSDSGRRKQWWREVAAVWAVR